MTRSGLALVLLALSLALPLFTAAPADAAARQGLAAAWSATSEAAALPAPAADPAAALERLGAPPRGELQGSDHFVAATPPAGRASVVVSPRLPATATGHRLRGRDFLQYLPTGPPVHRP